MHSPLRCWNVKSQLNYIVPQSPTPHHPLVLIALLDNTFASNFIIVPKKQATNVTLHRKCLLTFPATQTFATSHFNNETPMAMYSRHVQCMPLNQFTINNQVRCCRHCFKHTNTVLQRFLPAKCCVNSSTTRAYSMQKLVIQPCSPKFHSNSNK